LASNLADKENRLADDPAVRDALVKAAEDPDPRTRAAAAVALGVVDGPENRQKLRAMLEDLDPNVRYNAAVRLAHHGDAAAVPVLIEMLDQTETAGVDSEKNEEMRPFKRALITINALRAAAQLAEKNRDADLSELAKSIEKINSSSPQGELGLEATNALRLLSERRAAGR
jgi:hypothetical protein